MTKTKSTKSTNGAVHQSDDKPDVSFLILRAFYDLRGMLDRLLKEHGLNEWVQPGMGPVLYTLYEKDDCTISDLAERVMLAPSTLTNTLKRMERNGLVELAKCSEDRRAVRIFVTPLGRKLKPKMQRLRERVQQTLHGNMSADDLHRTKRHLLKMIESMELQEWESKHPSKNKR